MENAIDLTTLEAVEAWLSMQSIPSTAEAQNIKDCITAASAELLWRTGRGDGAFPTVSPFVQAVDYDECADGNGNARLFLRNWPIISVTSLTVNGIAIPQSTDWNVPGYVIDGSGKSLALRPGGSRGFGAWPSAYRAASLGAGQYFAYGIQNVHALYKAGFAVQAVADELHTIPATPGPYTITLSNAKWLADTGVKLFSTGAALLKVSTAPATGQYYVQSAGVYLFNAAQQGLQVLISYTVPGTPSDLEIACRRLVALNYKRRQWIDQHSQSMAAGAGTITFRDWEFPPDVESVIRYYRRAALIGS